MSEGVKKGRNEILFLTDQKQIYYFTGCFLDDAYFIKAKESFLFVDSRYYFETLKLVKKGIKVVKISSIENVFDKIRELNPKAICLDYESVNVKDFESYKELGFLLKDVSSYLKTLFEVKSKKEIGLIKKSCSITERAFYKSIKKIKLNITEIKLKNIIESNIKSLCGDGPSFEIIVAFGENSGCEQARNESLKKLNNHLQKDLKEKRAEFEKEMAEFEEQFKQDRERSKEKNKIELKLEPETKP